MQDANILFDYFPNLTAMQKGQFSALGALYREWNKKINVISRKDTANLYTNHVLHSLGIAKVISFRKGCSILDAGTGGGFPGIPLAILFPEAQFHLIDSIGKKIAVVNAIAGSLGLANVLGEKIRAEETKNKKYDFVVGRAVTRMKEFYGRVSNKIKPESAHDLENGILYLKGGELNAEMAELKKPYSQYELSDYLNEDFFETKKVVYVPVI